MAEANSKHILIKDGEQLTRILNKTEECLDKNQSKIESLEARISKLDENSAVAVELRSELESVKSALEKNSCDISQMQERVKEQHDNLPRGDRVYRGITDHVETNADREAKREVANIVMDSILLSRHSKPRFSSYRNQTEFGGSPAGEEGGLLVPEIYLPRIYRIFEAYGVARQLFNVMDMASTKVNIPTNGDLPTVYWDSQLSGARELVAPTASNPVTFERPALEARKLIGIDTLSIEVLEDSIPFIQDFVVDMFSLAMAKEEDRTAFMSDGTGTEPFSDGGLMYLSGIGEVTSEQTTYAEALADDNANSGAYFKLLSTLDKGDESVGDFGTWVFSNSILNGIRLVRDTTGQPLTTSMMAAGPQTLFGRPYKTSRVFPKMTDSGSQNDKPFILIGDFRYAFMGQRRGIQIDTSSHAAFKEYGVVVRVAERIAFKTILKAPFARLLTHA